MKKILSVIALILCMCMAHISVMANNGSVEISFRVGDSTLKINGVDTTVETPYVVGDGVTLVPVRVITEAFGAKVGWIEETETVTLEYPDVNIILQIGNRVAEVNGKAVTLLAAPELTEAGYTMVPLRFISESFGAEVSYDEISEAIKVVKQSSDNSLSTVIGAIDNDYIGDSYFGWTMENPKDMTMEERSFDGMYTNFSYGEKNAIYITYKTIDEDYDFEKAFSDNKSALSDYTLVKADKKTDDAIKSAHFQAKDKQDFLNIQYYVTDKYLAEVVGIFDNSDATKRDEFVRIMSTFRMKFDSSKAYDLSNAKDGWRNFVDDFTGLSLMIPDDYFQYESDSQNEFDFMSTSVDDNVSRISVGMYSKSEVGSASDLAAKDLENNKRYKNENVVKYSDVINMTYNDINAYEYTEYVSGGLDIDCERKDVFFEIGDYVYNISIVVKMPGDRKDVIMSKVLWNLKVNDTNSEEIGIIMRNDPDSDSTFTSKNDDWSMELPNTFSEIASSDDDAIYLDSLTGTMLTMYTANAERANTDTLKILKDIVSESMKEKHTYTEEAVNQERIASRHYTTATLRFDKETRSYVKHYVLFDSGKLFLLSATIPELTYSNNTLHRIENISKSITVIR